MVGKTAGLAMVTILFGLTLSTVCAADSLGRGQRIETTEGRIYGTITAIDLGNRTLTVTEGSTAVLGLLDQTRTRVSIAGQDGSPGQLRDGFVVRARLGLDDVWDNIVVVQH